MRNLREVRKVLSPNDLGLTGSHQAGIAIPKDPDILSFFPSLDSGNYNPDCWLSVATPEFGSHHEIRYIYYNSKLHGQGTRNEYRLTGTTRMLREMRASVGDVLTFRRNVVGDIEARLRRPDPEPYSKLENAVVERVLRNGWRLTISDIEE